MFRTYSEWKTAVLKASTPELAAGTFVEGLPGVIENSQNDPHVIAQALRTDRQIFINSLTNGNGK